MSNSESGESYSTIFTPLKHSVRHKLLRLLSIITLFMLCFGAYGELVPGIGYTKPVSGNPQFRDTTEYIGDVDFDGDVDIFDVVFHSGNMYGTDQDDVATRSLQILPPGWLMPIHSII